MNSKKGKGKPRPKPVNPQSPQKEADEEKVENVSEEIIESSQKSDERVPEIISEIVIPPVESKGKEDDGPKKPKRNRGKKKKQDGDESEPQEELPAEKVEDVQLEIIEQVMVDENLTPSARKKKNKNKKTAEPEIKLTEQPPTEIPLGENKPESETIVKEDIKPQNTEDAETKAPKKKNKKKKQRNDSERSDVKAEEISCISAFQQLLKDEKSDTKISDSKPISADVKSEELKIEDSIKKEDAKEIPEDTTKLPGNESGKNKKKNKKDKKEPPKEVEADFGPNISLVTAIKPVSKEEVIIKDDRKPDEPSPVVVSKIEEDVKPKAKIAKPVERKRKGKADEDVAPENIALVQEPVTKDTLTVKPSEEKAQNVSTEQTEAAQETSKQSPIEEQKMQMLVAQTILDAEAMSGLAEIVFEDEMVIPEDKIPELLSVGEIKSNVQPEEKKGKGKNKKQSQDVFDKMLSKNIETKDQPILDVFAKAELKTETKTDTSKNDKFIVPDTVVEFEAKEGEQEIPKISEKKRKGKKNAKGQEVPLEAPIEDKELKILELPTPEQVRHSILSNLLADTKHIDSAELKKLDTIESQDTISKTSETKRKGKKEKQTTDVVHEELKIKEEIISKPEVVAETVNIPKPEEILQHVLLMPDPIESIQSRQELSDVEELKETSFISLPESGMGKKRKKSPKPGKQDQKQTILEIKPEIALEITDTIKKDTTLPVNKESKIDEMPISLNIILAGMQPEEAKPTEIIEDKIQDTEDKTPFETKTKKKRKKSPRLPQEQDTAAEAVVATKEMKKHDDVETDKSKTGEMLDLPSDIEIISLKAEDSEGSACGFTPDIIQHPRATSQNFPDDNNNNTSIREITVAEEVKLQIPTDVPDTPLIQGSGSTPLETPDNILVGIKITKVDTEPNKTEPEKTDLKSKMMEVNQDMEELRLSIERSLAEFTAIEKNEGEIEKQFQEKNVALEGIKTECKISMPTEIIAKTQLEKTESPTDKQLETILFTSPAGNIPVETTIPPKASMFFDKELKGTDVESAIPKSTELAQSIPMPPVPPLRKSKSSSKERENKDTKTNPDIKPIEISTQTPKPAETTCDTSATPVCPSRKDHKNKGKNKKKGKQEATQAVIQGDNKPTTTESNEPSKETKKDEKTEQKPETTKEKGKQQSDGTTEIDNTPELGSTNNTEFDPIENFEDAMTSSADDINKTFEMIADEARTVEASLVNPEIRIVAPVEDKKKDKRDEKINPVSQPKNLLGHPDIPVRLNKTDYKKEKNKSPNEILAKVKIKDSVQVEAKKQSKDTQTDNIRKFLKSKSIDESFSSVTNENDEFIYKYSFRKVFLQSACHVCKKELKQARVPCSYCNLVFYCSAKHKDEDWSQHQGLCFAISTIVHLKDQKHIYADTKNITGQDYRLLRMQMIVSCERVLKRKLSPWEQEALLYPRMCADVGCREWRQSKLQDCDGCGQMSYCSNNINHFSKVHQRWCKSYALYQKLVCYQQTKGRVEPKLPGKVMEDPYKIPEKISEAIGTMYEDKIEMNDIQYAALTQIATAPLTTAYCHQTYASTSQANGTYKKTSCTVHIVGGELQFEADALNKWEVFFLHLRPQLQDLRVVMIGSDLNPSNLPLELLKKVVLCEGCRLKKRRVTFSFHDNTSYPDYRASDDYLAPDIVCAFNPSIKRASIYNGKDPWPKTINHILKQKVPFLITSHTINELQRDLARVKECSDVEVRAIIDPRMNAFASARPDRNFISDDEMPLLFNNYCFALVAGVNSSVGHDRI